jgi:hypothetical protein
VIKNTDGSDGLVEFDGDAMKIKNTDNLYIYQLSTPISDVFKDGWIIE